MRFAGNTSNVSSYIQAGRAGAKGAADFFKVARANAPDYGGLAEANMNARSAERIAATQAEAYVARAGLEAKADVKKTRIKTEAEAKILDKKIDAKRKAGMVGMFGAAAGGLFMGMENKRAEAKAKERDAAREKRENERFAYLQGRIDGAPEAPELTAYQAGTPPKSTPFKVTPFDPSKVSGSNTSNTSNTSNKSGQTLSGSLSGIQKQTADLVAKYESTSSGGYDAFNLGGSDGGHTAHGSGDSSKGGFAKPLTQMTIGEIRKLGNSGQIHATGRYQFTHNTGSFGEAVSFAGLSDNDLFSPENQDKMFLAFGQKYGPSRWIGLKNASADEMAIIKQGLNWN